MILGTQHFHRPFQEVKYREADLNRVRDSGLRYDPGLGGKGLMM